ncbi:uncharacterized protein A4U43_C05F14430 [Asparagus officinalis]|uniref:Uncharacterized protein n=1 Tax=Asparagus officinalis TaxID=4686 RepID=A0A5P1ERK7_ASPOF|nr:uncharacterized protein A4U43_C05F14430 [Asparagus officinalis]
MPDASGGPSARLPPSVPTDRADATPRATVPRGPSRAARSVPARRATTMSPRVDAVRPKPNPCATVRRRPCRPDGKCLDRPVPSANRLPRPSADRQCRRVPLELDPGARPNSAPTAAARPHRRDRARPRDAHRTRDDVALSLCGDRADRSRHTFRRLRKNS